MNILIIDDELSSLNTFLANIVDETDIKYSMFMNNPNGALEFAENNKLDAAFLDINMPKINGVELAKQLLTIKPELRIVFITGYEQNKEEIKKMFGESLLGFCNKPYDTQTLLNYISEIKMGTEKQKVYFKTFPSFDMFVNDKIVMFKRSKSKELLALLVDRRGGSIQIGEAVAFLWGDKPQDLSKRLYRDATSRLRLALDEYNLSHIVNFGRGQLSLNTEGLNADIWNVLDGIDTNINIDNYLTYYEWGQNRQNEIRLLLNSKRFNG